MIRQRDRRHVNSLFGQLRHERIVVDHVGTIGGEKPDDVQGRGFPDIVDVPFVRDAEHQDAGAVHGLLTGVQGGPDFAHHELGHLGVDLRSELDETRPVVERAHLPRQIVGVDRDAVPSEPGSGCELHEAEGFRGRRFDHLPHVHVEPIGDERNLVHESDVHGPEGVLQDLDHLRRLGGRNRHHGVDETVVDGQPRLRTRRCHPSEDLRRILRLPFLVTGIHPLGRETQEEVLTYLQSRALQGGKEYLAGRARIGGRLENHELPGPQRRRHRFGRGDHKRDVGILRFRQRSGHGNRDGITLAKPGHVGGGLQPSRGQNLGQLFIRDVIDVAGSLVDAVHDLGIDVEAQSTQAGSGDLHRQRQPYVTETDHTHGEVARAEVVQRSVASSVGHQCLEAE